MFTYCMCVDEQGNPTSNHKMAATDGHVDGQTKVAQLCGSLQCPNSQFTTLKMDEAYAKESVSVGSEKASEAKETKIVVESSESQEISVLALVVGAGGIGSVITALCFFHLRKSHK